MNEWINQSISLPRSQMYLPFMFSYLNCFNSDKLKVARGGAGRSDTKGAVHLSIHTVHMLILRLLTARVCLQITSPPALNNGSPFLKAPIDNSPYS